MAIFLIVKQSRQFWTVKHTKKNRIQTIKQTQMHSDPSHDQSAFSNECHFLNVVCFTSWTYRVKEYNLIKSISSAFCFHVLKGFIANCPLPHVQEDAHLCFNVQLPSGMLPDSTIYFHRLTICLKWYNSDNWHVLSLMMKSLIMQLRPRIIPYVCPFSTLKFSNERKMHTRIHV